MKASKIIWDQNKLIKLFIYFRQSGNSLSRLLCASCVIIFISGCTSWPDNSERELSVSHRTTVMPPGVDSEHLAHLLEVSKKRYVELEYAGAKYCLPGQMLKVIKKQDLIEHEIDGDLLPDARIHLKFVFDYLYKIKKQVGKNKPSKTCYEEFAAVHDVEPQVIGGWESFVEIDALKEDEL